MHWFDLDRAMPEIARVLTPGGVLAGLWNVDDDRVDWVAELAEISKHNSSVTLLRWREGDRELPSGAPHRGRFGEFRAAQSASSSTGTRGPPIPSWRPSPPTPISW